MGREEIFSKLNIRDYNNELEKILEKKSFSEGTKNILLNILYKMETSYDDYNKVKVYTSSKKDMLGEMLRIIEEDCNEIELVKPKLNEETKLGDKKFIVEDNKIISYPNEKAVCYGLYNLEKNSVKIKTKYGFLKRPLEKLLNKGKVIDTEEIIRDFDGWSWNVVTEEFENYICNIVYQNIKILVGNEFLQEQIDKSKESDFIEELELRLKLKYGEELAQKILISLYKISILEEIRNDNKKLKDFIKIEKIIYNNFERIANKKQYLQELDSEKKKISKEIKRIDEIMSDSQILRKEFMQGNLRREKKIFSLSDYTDLLQNRRERLLIKLNKVSKLMEPFTYVQMKLKLKENIELFEEINLSNYKEKQIDLEILDLQKNFLKAFNKTLRNIENKKEIIEKIFVFRYYKLIPEKTEKLIKDIEELKPEIKKTEKYLITKACNLRAINILCNNVEKNYEIISSIFNYRIIDLEEILLEMKKNDDRFTLKIYDDNAIAGILQYEEDKEFNIKLNKKTKLFI